VTSGAGGGTDNFARIIQSIITKHKLIEQPIVVVNKGGGSGAEGYVYGKGAKGDPNRVIFGTNNAYLLPYVAKLGYKFSDLTPVAALALDEFLLWVNGSAPYADAKSYLDAVKAKPMGFKMGGSQSKDTDQTLTSMIQDAGAPSGSTCRSRAAAPLPCSSPAAISTPTSTTPTRISASGRPDR
jgi:putative tricarboxylic transport membrane protein